MTRLALLCLVAAACSGSGSNSPPPSPSPTPSPSPSPAPAPSFDVSQLGSACAEGDKCAPPMECVKYYGIAGAKGGQLSSCEVRCEATACPEHTRCATIADGPGKVCRPDAN